MTRDQLIGGLMMAAAVIGILVYAWILFFTDWALILLQITAFIAVAGVLGILAWIGYTLATTPPPKPIEEIEKELEKEVEAAENDSKQGENSSD
ncbi:MAG: transcriptional regulator [Thaumarchaeota archaeon]|nr:MAG: transcriptional regulator [Nitrososphaerota archaeon]